MPIVLVGTLDTKGRELSFVRDQLQGLGLSALLIDAGSSGEPVVVADLDREQVFEKAGTTFQAVRERGDRGQAVTLAAKGVAEIVKELAQQGKVEGILALGGSAGTTIGTSAMRALPFGVPKVMVSTLASGPTRPYIGGSDILMMHSVADLAGLNRFTRTVLSNAAHALAGMVLGRSKLESWATVDAALPVIAATMFGVTTPCVDHARSLLEKAGREVLVFHATGVGGQSMEGLIRDGQVQGVLDLTTTELADELLGGILSAGPDRLEAAGRAGIPQVVSVGALDMVNFGPIETVPDRYRGRNLHIHNPNVTLMRTTADECAILGQRMAEILFRANGPVVVLIPQKGISALDTPGQPFHDPQADAKLFEALETGLRGARNAQVIVRDEHINDSSFAECAVLELNRLMQNR